MTEIKPVKAWAATYDGEITHVVIGTGIRGRKAAINVVTTLIGYRWTTINQHGWRVIPVMIVPVEEKGRGDAEPSA